MCCSPPDLFRLEGEFTELGFQGCWSDCPSMVPVLKIFFYLVFLPASLLPALMALLAAPAWATAKENEQRDLQDTPFPAHHPHQMLLQVSCFWTLECSDSALVLLPLLCLLPPFLNTFRQMTPGNNSANSSTVTIPHSLPRNSDVDIQYSS